MIKSYTIYLPKSKRNIKVDVSSPLFKGSKEFDTLYMLDGQNAFKDKIATFGRSLRTNSVLKKAKKELNKDIIAVAIYSTNNEIARIEEYSPFKVFAKDAWQDNDISICHNLFDDIINTIIPFIESKYNVRKDPNSRFIYGSSLGGVASLFLGINYQAFNYIGAFSTATFLFQEEFDLFLNKITKDKSVFFYVGENEHSDEVYTKEIYLNTTKELYSNLVNKKINTTLVTDKDGIHNEAYWGKHLYEFINFIYK